MWYSPRSATKLSDMSNYNLGTMDCFWSGLQFQKLPIHEYMLLLPAIDPNLHEAKNDWVCSLA